MLKIILLFVLYSWPILSWAQSPKKLDMAFVDVVSANQLDGAKVSVYGFYLGMTKAEAKEVLLKNPALTVDHRSWNIIDNPFKDSIMFSTYIYDTDSLGNKRNDILYLGWGDKEPTLSHITVFNTFSIHAKGSTQKLFTDEIVNKTSSLYKKYFTRPVKSWPGSQFAWYYYPTLNLQIIVNKYQAIPRYYFILTKKCIDI
ncbi:MAG: hypothetical protein RL115_1948 [Bacteroidota bacterium]|jgi:hypothetical protein